MGETGRAATEAERVVEEVFLSPRVVDSATLAEFGQSLGELLRRAAEQREHLRRTVAEGESVASTLRDATSQATEKLRPAAKLIPLMDQKLALVEQSLARAAELTGSAERFAGEAARAAAGEGLAPARQAEQAIEQALSRARELEGRLGQLTQRAEMAVELLSAECKARLETAARHAQDVLGTMIAEIDTRAEQSVARAGALIEERRAAAEAALGEVRSGDAWPTGGMGGEHDGAEGASTRQTQSGPGAGAEVRAEIEALLESARSQVRAERQALDAHSAELEQRAAGVAGAAAEVAELASAAEARLRAVGGELALAEERGRGAASAANQALAAFDEELATRMHAVREMMEQLASVTVRATRAAEEPMAACGMEPDMVPEVGPEVGRELGVATGAEPACEPVLESPLPPGVAVETKPVRGPAGFVRIDRPLQSESPVGLPGRLKF